jgi:myo-inositol-1(or 4)-monophosphatase
MSENWRWFLPFADELADLAQQETLSAANAELVEDKGAGAYDPVTEADKAAERAIRKLIADRYPDHGVAGEEYGSTGGAGHFVWSVDPIDGTRQLVCGLPMWTTLLALLEDGEPILGIIDASRLGERYVGWNDGAVLRMAGEEVPLRVSGCTNLADARLSTTDPYLFAGDEADAFERIRQSVRVTRLGCDGYAYARLAAGSIDLVIESGLKTHDWNALVPVIRGAGGVVGNWRGGEDLSGGDVVAAATAELFDQTVALLANP